MSELQEALRHLGNILAFAADIHPDDRCEALDKAMIFYNTRMPNQKVEPSGYGYQRLVNPPLPELDSDPKC